MSGFFDRVRATLRRGDHEHGGNHEHGSHDGHKQC